MLFVFIGIFVAALLTLLFFRFQKLRLFRGYSDYRHEARAIEKFLAGQTFRDGTDLVISGNVRTRRTIVRFSQDEHLPGLMIRMDAPAVFNLSLVPKSSTVDAIGLRVKSGIDYLEARRVTRSEDPTMARMFLAEQVAANELCKLCYSSETLVNIEPGVIEYSELTVTQSGLSRRLINHLESMAAIADQLARMPEADRVKLERVVPPRPTGKVVFAVLVVVAVCSCIAGLAQFQRDKRMNAATAGADGAPQGIPADEAARIPDLKGWRLSGSPDFEPGLVRWLQQNDVQPAGRIEGDFLGGGDGTDHAYLLINEEGARRVVIVIGGQVKFDETFPAIAAIAKIPSTTIRDVKLEYGSRPSGNSDGVLLVRDQRNPGSGLIISFNAGSLITAVPENYQATELR